MAKTPAIMIPCQTLTEYQLLPAAFLLLLDRLGRGINPASGEHAEQTQCFVDMWDSLEQAGQERFCQRMANLMLSGADLERANRTVPEIAQENLVREMTTLPLNANN